MSIHASRPRRRHRHGELEDTSGWPRPARVQSATRAAPSPRRRNRAAGRPPELTAFSYGGGWQSTAALALAARGELDFRTFLFANVGDDSEDPATLAYLREHAIPFARQNGIDLHELHRTMRDGTPETLYGRLTKPGSRSLPIPVRMSNGAPGTRACTADFKIRVVGKWLKSRGASADNPATIGIGISLDEIERANTRHCEPHERLVYPLLDRRIRRSDCPRIIKSVGLPVPPPSSCWFCPHHRPSHWQAMRLDRPELFQRACELEELLNVRRSELGRDPVWLTRFNMPLDRAIADHQALPFDDDGDGCDGGWCFT